MSGKRVKILLLTVIVAISLFLLIEKNFLPGFSSKLSPYKSLELLGKVIHLIKNDYIEEANPDKTMKGAFKGMVDSLDTLSCYLDKESMLRYHQRKETDLKDIGVVLYKKYGFFPSVVGVIEKSSAQEKGIQIGDLISNLDGQSTLMMSLIETRLYLKNRNNNPVKLKVLRNNKTQEVTAKRELLYKELFSFSPANDTNGILKIHKLFSPCVRKIKEKVIPRLKSQQKTLILDLRNCYEGDMEEALRLINLFVKAQKIGYFEKKGGAKEFLSCPDNDELKKLPLIIWTNQATLGPSEAVAGVLKELKKAKIIGYQTLGLVAKQNLFALEDGTGLILTSGIFHLMSGEKLWEKGVKPDIKIKKKDQNFNSYLKKSLSSLS